MKNFEKLRRNLNNSKEIIFRKNVIVLKKILDIIRALSQVHTFEDSFQEAPLGKKASTDMHNFLRTLKILETLRGIFKLL